MTLLVKGIKFVQHFLNGSECIIDCELAEILENTETSVEKKRKKRLEEFKKAEDEYFAKQK
jgi:hypothetical protein